MASLAENPKAARGVASRHTCKASPVPYDLDRPNCFVPTGHHTGERWPHAAHHLRSCFRTNVPQLVPQHTPARGSRRIGAAA